MDGIKSESKGSVMYRNALSKRSHCYESIKKLKNLAVKRLKTRAKKTVETNDNLDGKSVQKNFSDLTVNA